LHNKVDLFGGLPYNGIMEKEIQKMKISAANAKSDLGRNKDLFYYQRDSRGHNLTGRFLSAMDFGDPPHIYEVHSEEHSNIGLYIVMGIIGFTLLTIVF
jgi:hypothetical protein